MIDQHKEDNKAPYNLKDIPESSYSNLSDSLFGELDYAADTFVKANPDFYLSSDIDQPPYAGTPTLLDYKKGYPYLLSHVILDRLYLKFCSKYPYFDGKVLSLLGCRPVYPNRIYNDPVDECPDILISHLVCLDEEFNYVVDLAYRHLDQTSEKLYHIQHFEELKQQWCFIASTRELFESFTRIGHCLSQATNLIGTTGARYVEASRHFLAEDRRTARACYDIVAAAYKEGTILLPGTVEDNPYLKLLTEEWPKLFID
jgi:hypothetical protein